jgi:hypothetical protein
MINPHFTRIRIDPLLQNKRIPHAEGRVVCATKHLNLRLTHDLTLFGGLSFLSAEK